MNHHEISAILKDKAVQVPQPSQSTIFDSHGQPSCDLERLLSCVTPVLMLNGQPATGETDGQTACLVSLALQALVPEIGKEGPAPPLHPPSPTPTKRGWLRCQIQPGHSLGFDGVSALAGRCVELL